MATHTHALTCTLTHTHTHTYAHLAHGSSPAAPVDPFVGHMEKRREAEKLTQVSTWLRLKVEGHLNLPHLHPFGHECKATQFTGRTNLPLIGDRNRESGKNIKLKKMRKKKKAPVSVLVKPHKVHLFN